MTVSGRTLPIVRGSGFAKQLGFPTLNVRGLSLRPGVYTARTNLGPAVIVRCRLTSEIHLLRDPGDATIGSIEIVGEPEPLTRGPKGGMFEALLDGLSRVRPEDCV